MLDDPLTLGAAAALVVVLLSVRFLRKPSLQQTQPKAKGAASAAAPAAKSARKLDKRLAAAGKVRVCKFCEVRIESAEHCVAHLAGKKHRKLASTASDADCFVLVDEDLAPAAASASQQPAAAEAAPAATAEEQAAVAGPGWEKVTKAKKPRDAGAGGPTARRTQRGFVLQEHGQNVLEGLELHHNVLSAQEQARLAAWCEEQLAQGKRGFLGGSTYMQSTVPKKVVDSAGATARRADKSEKWTRGTGREVLQYGVFYDYGGHRIDEDKEVEPMPEELQKLARLVCARGVVPQSKVPIA